MRKAVNVLLAFLFVFFAPALLLMGVINVNEPLYAAAFFGGSFALAAVFFVFAGFRAKTKCIILFAVCVLAGWNIFRFHGGLPSFATAKELEERFGDVHAWNPLPMAPAPAAAYRGSYIYYNLNEKKPGKSEVKLEDVEVIVAFRKSMGPSGTYRSGGKKYADGTLEMLEVYLFDAKTRKCFASERFEASVNWDRVREGGHTVSPIYETDARVTAFVHKYVAR